MGEWHAGALSVHIDESVMDAIYADRDAAIPREVGGILFGTYPDSCSIRVSDVIMCEPGGLCDFERTPPDPDTVKSLWGRGIYFVGDWHSHPGSSPRPSSTDIATMLETANDPAAKCPAPIMLVVGDWDSLTGAMNGEVVFFDPSEAPTKKEGL